MKSVFKIILITIFLTAQMQVIAQSDEVETRRAREHQAVKDFAARYMKNYSKSVKKDDEITTKQEKFINSLSKTEGMEDRKSYFMNGNRIAVQLYNYGGIGPGYGLLRNVNNFVWHDLGYIFAFGPIVGAMVPEDSTGDLIPIISDGLNDYTSPMLQELSPTGDTLWQWQPLPGYADPDQPDMASNPAADNDEDGKPDSWPRDWYNPTLGEYVWPGYLKQGTTNADAEVFWAMDDRDNAEFDYYPLPDDRSRRGLGVQVDGRAFQWSNALAENTIFFVYTITNTSEKPLDSVFFGIYGDPDLGGGSPENTDDNGFFVPPYSLDTVDVSNIPPYARSMVYFWDPDGVGNYGLPLGYLGCKFLESPGHPTNGIDDDGDGMIDESQEDGIDNDGDWVAELHDVGIDGIPNTNDFGEGDGQPTAGQSLPDGSPHPLYPGEPNFEFTDLDESDQIGLTSFNSWTWNQDKISDDVSMWNRSIPRNFGAIQQNTDLVFIFGSGYISLEPGETKRISMALLCGEDLDDLLISAEVVQTIYNQNYQFFKPPNTPKVWATPGDKKVTLYWDTIAEESIDPITGKDFEGYVIYRSTDPSFKDIQTVTDGKGSAFLSEPLKTSEGFEAKWDQGIRDEPYTDVNGNGIYDQGEPYTDWDANGNYSYDIEDVWQGYHPVPYQKRGVQYYLGSNTGLVHSFVDSNNVINGQTYYYAVVAYDHGDSTGIPPTETTKKIALDPITNKLTFDDNTVSVVPGPRASGYVEPVVNGENVDHVGGIGTGAVSFDVKDDLSIVEGGHYTLSFSDSINAGSEKIAQKNYSVLNDNPITESFITYGTKFALLKNEHIVSDELLKVTGAGGTEYTEGTDYIVKYKDGAIRRVDGSSMPDSSEYNITYRYYPVYQSTALNGEDSNPVFDGIHTSVMDEPALAWDKENTGWVEGSSNFTVLAKLSTLGVLKAFYPGDYEIEFADEYIDTAITFTTGVVRIPVNYSVREISTGVPRHIVTFLNENSATRDSSWDPGEGIVFFAPGSEGTIQDTLTWEIVINFPTDSTVVPVAPGDGDILLVATKRPFKKQDRFELATKAGWINNTAASSSMDNIYVVPNPYLGYNEIEPVNKLPGQSRGEKRIYFENLPSQCTIRIFTISGDPVKTLEHDSGLENGREYWNLLNEDGFGVAYGVYIAHVDAPGVGEKILKFALIK